MNQQLSDVKAQLEQQRKACESLTIELAKSQLKAESAIKLEDKLNQSEVKLADAQVSLATAKATLDAQQSELKMLRDLQSQRSAKQSRISRHAQVIKNKTLPRWTTHPSARGVD